MPSGCWATCLAKDAGRAACPHLDCLCSRHSVHDEVSPMIIRNIPADYGLRRNPVRMLMTWPGVVMAIVQWIDRTCFTGLTRSPRSQIGLRADSDRRGSTGSSRRNLLSEAETKQVRCPPLLQPRLKMHRMLNPHNGSSQLVQARVQEQQQHRGSESLRIFDQTADASVVGVSPITIWVRGLRLRSKEPPSSFASQRYFRCYFVQLLFVLHADDSTR